MAKQIKTYRASISLDPNSKKIAEKAVKNLQSVSNLQKKIHKELKRNGNLLSKFLSRSFNIT